MANIIRTGNFNSAPAFANVSLKTYFLFVTLKWQLSINPDKTKNLFLINACMLANKAKIKRVVGDCDEVTSLSTFEFDSPDKVLKDMNDSKLAF